MKIGLDFDHTIVNYDKIFYDLATEWEIVPREISAKKLAIRDFLRKAGKEELWTQMQGLVYGLRIQEATAYPGLLDFVESALKVSHSIVIISHKTERPFLGPPYDLHKAAHQWIRNNICRKGNPLLSQEFIFFETTKEKKLERIYQVGCELFIDDLPEILLSPNFPKGVSPILFDPDEVYRSYAGSVFSSWQNIRETLGLL